MRWRVRPVLEQDLPAIVSLERATPELPHWKLAEYARYVAAEAGRGSVLLLLTEEIDTGGLAGFAAASLCASDGQIVELESLAVLPALRRNGLARLLCGAVMEWSRQSGATVLQLEVRSESAGAIELYRALGFECLGKRSRYYANPSDDALLLSRAL